MNSSVFPQVVDCLAGDLGEDVGLAQDEQLVTVDGDVRTAVLRVEDLVALGHVERDALAVAAHLAVAGGEYLAALRLLLRGVGEDDAAGSRLLLLDRLDDQSIAEGLELHEPNLRQRLLDSQPLWHSSKESAKCRLRDLR